MEIINIREAKAHLSQLVQRATRGEEIIIAKAGKPMAKLVPYRASTAARQPGFWRGRVRIREDFDELPEEIEAAFLCSEKEAAKTDKEPDLL